MNIIKELNAGKKLRRKGWLEHKDQESLYISKVNCSFGDMIALWTNNTKFSRHDKIISDGDYWAVCFHSAAQELLCDDWEIIE